MLHWDPPDCGWRSPAASGRAPGYGRYMATTSSRFTTHPACTALKARAVAQQAVGWIGLDAADNIAGVDIFQINFHLDFFLKCSLIRSARKSPISINLIFPEASFSVPCIFQQSCPAPFRYRQLRRGSRFTSRLWSASRKPLGPSSLKGISGISTKFT